MTILYSQNQFPVLSQTFVENEIRGLLELGNPVVVLSARKSELAAPVGCSILVIEDLGKWRTLLAHVRMAIRQPRRYVNYLTDSFRAGTDGLPWSLFIPAIWEELGAAGVVHIHTHFATRAAVTAAILARALNVPRSVTTHAADIYSKSPSLEKQLAGAAVATVTEFNRRFLEDLGYRDVFVVRCGVDTQQAGTPPRESKLHDISRESARPPLVLSVGRLVQKKGHDDLITAVALLKARGIAVRCLIVGEGPERERLESQIRLQNLREEVLLTGPLPHSRIAELMSDASVFALACKTGGDGDTDGLPVVFLEAALARVPIVGGIVAGIGEFVNASNGWPVEPGDAAALASAVEKALTADEEVQRRVSSAHEMLRANFSLDAQISGVLALFAAAKERNR